MAEDYWNSGLESSEWTNSNTNIGNSANNSGSKGNHQYGIIYDLIAEGEIDGLVNGMASIYLNETPLIDASKVTSYGARRGRATTTANGTTATSVNDAGSLAPDLLSGVSLSDGPRFVLIEAAGPSANTSGLHNAGVSKLTAASAIFTADMAVTSLSNATGQRFVRIPGAGERGDPYTGVIVGFIDTSNVIIAPALPTTITAGAPKTIYLDHLSEVSNIASSTTATLDDAPPTAVTGTPVQLLPAVRAPNKNDFNFENVSGDFKPGTRTQQIPAAAGGAPSASFIKGLGTELQWTSGFGGSAGAITISSTAAQGLGLSATAAREMDKVKIVIEFPAGLICTDSDGDNHSAVAEFQIFLQYKKDANEATVTDLVVGRASPGSWTAQGANNDRNKGASRLGTVIGKTRGNFFVEYTINLQEFQPLHSWSIQIKRCTPEEDTAYIGNVFTDASFTGIANIKTVEAQILDKFTYPNSAYAITTFSAQDFPQPPGRAFHIRGKKIKVPTNYITREDLNRSSP